MEQELIRESQQLPPLSTTHSDMNLQSKPLSTTHNDANLESQKLSTTCTDVNLDNSYKTDQRRVVTRHTTYLSSNVRTWMDPVACIDVRDNNTEGPWWEHRTAPVVKKSEGSRTRDPGMISSSQLDYQYRGSGIIGSSRFSSKPQHARHPATSGAPIYNGIETLHSGTSDHRTSDSWREKISYQHIYDSRKNPNYPLAGKRQGCFVLDKTYQ